MATPTKVDWQGKSYDGESLAFEAVKEPWAEYSLEDGSVVRVRVVVSEIVRTGVKTPSGDPLIVVKMSPLVAYKPAP